MESLKSFLKFLSTPFIGYFKLSSKQCLTSVNKKEENAQISIFVAFENLMYVIVCTRSNISHVVGVVNHFLLILVKGLTSCKVGTQVS